jgi:hypothetical protein
MRHADLHRATRAVPVAHVEAFQLMQYGTEAGGDPVLMIWNSRDGVTPYGTSHDGKEYRHAMRGYAPAFSAILPDDATFVWADYDRPAWEAMQRDRYAAFEAKAIENNDAGFKERFPTVAEWLAIVPFEPGSPRLMTRAEWLAWTPSYAGHDAAELEGPK